MKVLFAALFLLDVLIHLLACCLPVNEKLRRITKCFLMPLLALWYCSSALVFSRLFLAGMLLGYAGDVSLIVTNKSWAFASGLAAFAAGHVCYAVYFFSRVDWLFLPPWWIITGLTVLYLLGIANQMRLMWPRLPKDLFPACLVYMLLICLMGMSAFLFAWSRGGLYYLAFGGSLLFLLSDCVLSYSTFCRRLPRRHQIVMCTYLPAQVMITATAAMLGGYGLWNF